jgi:hypothetical protein
MNTMWLPKCCAWGIALVICSGTVSPKLKFEQPIRLLIEVQIQNPAAKRPEIRIHQLASKPADEIISSGDYQWRNHGSVFTTRNVFSKIAKVSVRGSDRGWLQRGSA